jgi:hypothetical protein
LLGGAATQELAATRAESALRRGFRPTSCWAVWRSTDEEIVDGVCCRAVLFAGHAFAAGNPIVGTYAFSGMQSCMSANAGGFNAALEPNTPLAGVNTVIAGTHGFVKFNHDGTGTTTFNNFSMPDYRPFPPSSPGAASISQGTSKFTYTVTDDEIIQTPIDGTDTGSFTAGPRNGQTFVVTGQAGSVGIISKDHKTMTLVTLSLFSPCWFKLGRPSVRRLSKRREKNAQTFVL